VRKDLEKYRTEDWSYLEYDSDSVARRARTLRLKVGFLGLLCIALLAIAQRV
jgi:hypothetical protein